MLRSLCVAAVLLALMAGDPGRTAQAQSPASETSALRLAPAASEELSLEALLASYPVTPVAVTSDSGTSNRALVIGVGAIAGVVALNFYMGGLAYLPFTGVQAATPLATAESIVAISRVYAVTAAAAGGLVANWLYERSAP